MYITTRIDIGCCNHLIDINVIGGNISQNFILNIGLIGYMTEFEDAEAEEMHDHSDHRIDASPEWKYFKWAVYAVLLVIVLYFVLKK